MKKLNATQDIYGGVTVHPEDLPDGPDAFAGLLEDSLAAWRREGVRQVWLTTTLEQAALIPVAAAAGFRFHHGSDTRLTLLKHLVEDAVTPPGPTHLIGAGAVVLSGRGELLVVREKYERRPGFYKLPGGLLNPDEHIAEAIVREVREETGIETRFDALLCLTHLHGWQFEKSNLYLVCRLIPTTSDILIDERELAEARWMPLEDYLGREGVGAFNRRIVEATLDAPGWRHSRIAGLEIDPGRFEAYFPGRVM